MLTIIRTFAVVTVLLLSQTVYAQVQERHGLIRNSKPAYRLSADEKWLMVDDVTEADKRFLVYLNLTDWSVKTSRLLGDYTILPDMKAAYSNYIGSYAGGAGWAACERFCAYYFSDVNATIPTSQWPDSNYLLGQMPDGSFVACNEFLPTPNYSSTVIKGLKTIDPLTGKTVKSLHEQLVIKKNMTEYSADAHVIGGSVLVWTKTDQTLVAVPLSTGVPVVMEPAAPIVAYTGTYALALNCAFAFYGPKGESFYNNRQIIYDLTTGKPVLDTMFRNQPGVVYVGTSSDGHVFMLDAKTGELKEQSFDGKKLTSLNTRSLQLPDIALYGLSQGYKLMVSRKANRVLLIPKYWKKAGEKANEMYAWDLTTGKMVYKISDFFSPHEKVLAARQKEVDMWSNYKVPEKQADLIQPGTLVKSTDGLYYVLLSYNAGTKVWDVIKLQKDRKGNYERSFTTKPAGIFTFVSNTKCMKCGGGGAMAVVRDQSSTSVDNYNARVPGGKVITTTTKQVEGTAVCSQCRGAGFVVGY